MPSQGLLDSFRNALAGIIFGVRTQRNLRIDLGAAGLAVGLGYALALTPVEWAILAVLIGGVLTAELMNTAIEALVDLVVAEYHPKARIAKDVAAGAVLTMAASAVVVGSIIFGGHLLALLVLPPA